MRDEQVGYVGSKSGNLHCGCGNSTFYRSDDKELICTSCRRPCNTFFVTLPSRSELQTGCAIGEKVPDAR